MVKLILIVGFLLWLLPQSAFGCSCSAPNSIGFDLQYADFVFTGKAISSKKITVWNDYQTLDGKTTKEKERETVYNFQTFEIFKGKTFNKFVEINAGNIYGSCGGRFEVGESYLVYAWGRNKNEIRATTSCNSSKDISRAEDEIYFIKKFIKGESEPQIYGRVSFSKVDETTGEYQRVFQAGLKIVIKSKENRFETLTNDSGIYAFNDIPTGKYKIEPIPPEDLRYSGRFSYTDFFVFPNKRIARYDSSASFNFEKLDKETLEKASSIIDVVVQKAYFESFYLGRDNKIEGKVFDINGKPIKFASVDLVPIQTPNREISNKSAEELSESKFWAGGEPPGKYLLAYEVNSFDQNGKLKRFFYPETTQPEKAKVFDIKPNEKLSLDLRVPLAIREIKGDIVWDDGTKIDENITIFVTKNKKFEWHDRFYLNYLEENNLEKTNKFSLQVFENNEFWLHVFVDGGDLEDNIEAQSKPRKVKVEDKDVELKILIPKPDILQKSN